jgi:DivIVA domain-containing protein
VIVLFGVLGIVVIGAVAVLLAKPRVLLADDPVPGRPPVSVGGGPVTAEQLAGVQFPIVARGYRMADVDAFVAAVSASLPASSQATDGAGEAADDKPTIGGPDGPEPIAPVAGEPTGSGSAPPAAGPGTDTGEPVAPVRVGVTADEPGPDSD